MKCKKGDWVRFRLKSIADPRVVSRAYTGQVVEILNGHHLIEVLVIRNNNTTTEIFTATKDEISKILNDKDIFTEKLKQTAYRV